MKRFALAVVLTCALSSTALAGLIPSTDAPAPAPVAASPVIAVILSIISIVAK